MKRNRILITNRGPDFTSGKFVHKGIGWTKDAYVLLMNHFCDQWLCLASEDINGWPVQSKFWDTLKVYFIEKDNYQEYYYKFVSECLYPTLLGYSDRAISLWSYPVFSQVSEFIAKNIESLKWDLILCDYHLFKIPTLIQRECKKTFFWFIPFLTRQYYSPIFEEIVVSLSKCDELFFLNEEYATNFKVAFRWYFPNEPLTPQIYSLALWPNDDFSRWKDITEESYFSLLKSIFWIDDIWERKFLLSVSRMDFVRV